MTTRFTIRRTLLGALAAGTVLAAAPAMAQNFPTKPLHIVVPFSPGGGTDAVARVFGDKMSELLGQPVVVDNKPGAGSIIGATAVAKAPADGYTMLLAASNVFTTNQFIYPKMSYQPQRDFQLVYQVARIPQVFVVTSKIPAKNAAEFMDYLKANKSTVAYGSYGIGSYPHLAGAYLSNKFDADMTHVAYKGEAPILQDMLSGNLQMTVASAMGVKPFVEDGRFRALGVTGSDRIGVLPDVPTMKEQGFAEDAYRSLGWLGIAVPAATPKPIVDRLNETISKIAQMPDVKKRLDAMGFVVVTDSSPDAVTAITQRDLPIWKGMLETSGAKFQ